MNYSRIWRNRENKPHIGVYSLSSVVLLDLGGDFVITLREAIFSVLVAGIMTFFGFLIASTIEKGVHDKQFKYRQAAELMSDAEFGHAMRTDVGNAFASGKFDTVDPVTHPNLEGGHLSIVADRQHYTMHTRAVTYTTWSGKNAHCHTRIETYWTWDTKDVKKMLAKCVTYCGSKFDTGKFDYSNVDYNVAICQIDSNDRIVFTYWPTTFNATVFSEFKGGTISDNTKLYVGITSAELRKDFTKSRAVGIFWTVWIIMTIVVIGVFFYFENIWLEDKSTSFGHYRMRNERKIH